jgi:tetratricopeptide (TPR) repeat protein
MTEPAPSARPQVHDSGAVADRDVAVTGANAAGRDIVIHHQTVQASSAPTVIPSELPMAVIDFVDRQEHCEWLCNLLDETLSTGQTTVVAISGAPGIGKTALALCVAHRMRHRFDGGNLFMDLSGAVEMSLSPSAVLGEFLLALGAARIPDAVADLARLYRSMLSRGRYLILLDNARDESQVRPLLPAAAGCAAILTSRRRLALLEGVRTVTLDVLDEPHAIELLGAVAGVDRVTTQAADARRIVGSTGGFPLALRIAAARLADRPHWHLSRLADGLDDERRRLGELQMGDSEVRAGFALTYASLDPQARQLFRLLGLVDVLDFAPWLPAVLLETEADEAEEVAEQLCEAHLLQAVAGDASGQVRYRFHDLLRAFARERLNAETGDVERSAVLGRVLDAYYELTLRADAGFSAANSAVWDRRAAAPYLLPPEHLRAAEDDHLRWFATERANLLRIIEQAAHSRQWVATWRLAVAMWQFFEITARWSDWRAAFDLALDAARQGGDMVAEGSCLRLLGRLALTRGDVDAAAALFDQAASVLSAAADLHGRCMISKDMSVVARLRNRHGSAIELLLSALDGFTRLDESYWVAVVGRELGIEYRYEGSFADAERHFRQAIATFERLGEHLQEAQTRFEYAVLERLRGNWAAAQECLDRATPVFGRLEARGQLVWALRESALVTAGTGDLAGAAGRLSDCLELWKELDDWRQYAGTLHELALLRQRLGQPDEAMAACREAIEVFRRVEDRLAEARGSVTCAVLSVELGAAGDAVLALEQALPSFRASGDLLWEVKAQRALAAAHRALGDQGAAREADILAEGLARYVRAADEARI